MSMINFRKHVETFGVSTVGVAGYYTIEAIKPGMGVVRSCRFKNLITDLGMDALGTSPQFLRMHLGTGTAAPSFSDTALANFGVNVSNNPGDQTAGKGPAPEYYGWMRLVWTSAVGGATGTWTEIGISDQNGNGNLRSRDLIRDPGGSPTSFPVLADEQFRGTYEFRMYPPLNDAAASIELSGTPYDTVTRALQINVASTGTQGSWVPRISSNLPLLGVVGDQFQVQWYSGGLGSLTDSNPQGSVIGSGTSARGYSTYGAGNFYLDSYAQWGGANLVGTLRTLRMRLQSGTVQIEYDPLVVKLDTETLRHNQRVHWARV